MIDSHCHINDDLYKENSEKYIEEALLEGVNKFLIIGSNLKDSKIALDIADKNKNCFAAIGIHPSDCAKANENDFYEIESLAKHNKVIAIGEIGLDYYWDKDTDVKLKQQEKFIQQITIANKLNLPICIHCRDAVEDCLKILKNNKVNKGGVVHCFSGSLETAKEFIKLGFILGFGGTTTFKNAVKVKEVIANIPDNSFVLETDAPYLAPTPFRGQPNHSKYLKYIRDEIALLRNTTGEAIEKITNSNFERVFLK